MKDYEFLDAVGGIDKRFIEKAECATAKRPVWNYVMPVAYNGICIHDSSCPKSKRNSRTYRHTGDIP